MHAHGTHLERLLGGAAGGKLELAPLELLDENLAVGVAALHQRFLHWGIGMPGGRWGG